MYERHDPEAQTLHRVLRENLATFYAAIEQGWVNGLPEFVRTEFAGYLDCSVLQRGFAHLACEDCGLVRLVAFTCAGRGFCPTCLGRRMNQTTHNLLAHVLPAQPLRQWVLSLPFVLRAPLAYEPGLMRVVARCLRIRFCVGTNAAWHRAIRVGSGELRSSRTIAERRKADC